MPPPGERIEDDLLIKRRQEPEHAPARRALSAAAAPTARRLPDGDCDLVLVWGEGCDFDAAAARGEDRPPRRLAAAGERPRRRLPADQHPDRAQRPLHELRRRREPLRAVLREAGRGRRRRGAVRRARAAGTGGRVMTQDLASPSSSSSTRWAMLITFGTVLTWVERKQAAVMSDRIGANRAYVRIPFTQVKLVWWGLFHGIADGLKMLLKENFKPQHLRPRRLRDRAVGRVHAGAAGLRRDPVRRHARSRRAVPAARRLVRRPHLPDADRPARRRPARRVRLQRPDHHRRDARRLVLGQQVLAARRRCAPARR